MKKIIILSATFIFLGVIGFNAYSKDTTISQDTLLYVKDHAGEHFLVLKVESCSLASGGEVHCAMKPEAKAEAVKAGPAGSFFERLAYPG